MAKTAKKKPAKKKPAARTKPPAKKKVVKKAASKARKPPAPKAPRKPAAPKELPPAKGKIGKPIFLHGGRIVTASEFGNGLDRDAAPVETASGLSLRPGDMILTPEDGGKQYVLSRDSLDELEKLPRK